MKYSRFNIEVPVENSNKVIVFNTFSRGLLLLEEELVTLLQSGNLKAASLTEQEKATLQQAEILVDKRLDEVAYLKYSFMKMKFGTGTVGMFINFSSKCNFKCTYCYQDFRMTGTDLSKANWEILFSFIKNHAVKSGTRNIGVALFGGEPLVNYRVLRQAVRDLKALEQNGISAGTELITNGSLLTKDRSMELAPYLDSAQITIDGPKSIHNKRRPYANGRGSFQDILTNLKDALKFTNIKINLRVNVDEENMQYVPELLQELKTQGLHKQLNSIGFSPVFPSQHMILDGCQADIKVVTMSQIADLFLYAVKLDYKIAKEFVVSPCMSYLNNSFVVDENLQVYKCPGLLYEQPDGVITSEGNLKIINAHWYKSVIFEPECIEDCVYAPICYGGCRWRAGGVNKINCNKEWLDKNIKKLIRAYAISNYALSL